MTLPNFFLLGAARAGTTAFYYQLRRHPQVFMSAVKEPGFYAFSEGEPGLSLSPEAARRYRDISVIERDEYEKLFADAAGQPVIGEASPVYLYSSRAPAAIVGAIPNAKGMAVLRDPVDRAYSSYLRRRQVDPDPEAFFSTAVREEEERLSGLSTSPVPLIDGGRYHQQVQRVRAVLGDRFLTLFHHDFRQDPNQLMIDVQNFLGIEPVGFVADAEQNASGVARWRWLEQSLSRRTRLTVVAKQMLPNRAIDRLATWRSSVRNWNLTKSVGVSDPVRTKLIEQYFADDIVSLQKMLGVDLSMWLAP